MSIILLPTLVFSEIPEKEKTGEKQIVLDTVIVTTTREGRVELDIPLATEVKTRSEIREEIHSSMVDVLEQTPGFTKKWEYHSPLVLRGLNQKRLILLKDGNRRMGSMPGGFMGHTMNIYDVDRIEIIRGPGSVTYGSGAIAGIINVITPDPFKNKSFSTRIGMGYGSNNNERLMLVDLGWNQGDFAGNVAGRFEKTDNYIFGNGKTAENSFTENKDFSVRLGWKPAVDHTTIFTLENHFGGPWGKPIGFNKNNQMKVNNEDENEQYAAVRHTIKRAGIFDSLVFSAFQDRDQRKYHKRTYTVLNKLSKHEIVKYKNDYSGGQVYFNTELNHSHILSAGLDGYSFRIDSPSQEADYFNGNGNFVSTGGRKNAGVDSIGLFVQDEYELMTDRLLLITGLRHDTARVTPGENTENSDSETRKAISGNVGFVYHPTETTGLSMNIGHAFRMPEAKEMFGKTISCKGTKAGNPELEPEYSWNIDLGFRGNHNRFTFNFAVFSNFLYDMIDENATVIDGENVLLFDNVSKARIAGGEFAVSYLFIPGNGSHYKLKPSVTLSYAKGDDLSDDKSFFESGEPLGIPPMQIKGSLWYMNETFSGADYFFEVILNYFAAQDRMTEEDKTYFNITRFDPYLLTGLKAGVKLSSLPGEPKLNLKITNLLDVEYTAFDSVLPGMGINAKLFAEMRF